MPQSNHKSIGVIGLGIIGRGVTGHLRRNGYPVYVWNRSPRPVPNFVGSPAELAQLCRYIQIFVSDDEALLQTVESLAEVLAPEHVVMAHSTVAPDSMRAASEMVERRGAHFVEAPFTGSKGAAEKGELVYYAGGAKTAVEKARPVLQASSKKIIEIGAIGQASAIKIATNMITAATIQAAAEALAVVQAFNVPFEKFAEAMRNNASYSATLEMKLPKMIGRDFSPHFAVKHMLKDMQIANQIGLSNYLDLGVTAAARDQLLEQTYWGRGDEDYSAVARKYLHELAPDVNEEPEAAQAAADLSPAITDSGASEVEAQSATLPASPPLPDAAPAVASASAEAPLLRRGLWKQLLSRFSSGKE